VSVNVIGEPMVDAAAPAAPQSSLLDVSGLSVGFGGRRGQPVGVVRDVSFRIEAGQTLVLLGESGSGKSVTARSLLRLYGANAHISGHVRLSGVDLLGLPEKQMRAHRGSTIGFVPQDAHGALDPLRRIGSQINEVLLTHGVADQRRQAGALAQDLLASVGIPDPGRVAHAYPHELSGGMRQRCLIAIAIACRPRLLIADEPTTALDVTIQAQVLDLLAQLQDEMHMGLLMVTHDVGVARQVADQVAVMYGGRLIETGTAQEVLDHPAHPYTVGLLGAAPTPDTPRGELQAIPGRPPNPADIPGLGCAFAPRCPSATDACSASVPAPVRLGPGRTAACLLVEPAGRLEAARP
jgi:oligopeptide/dipeptide ABC transporter ATP-binding protein